MSPRAETCRVGQAQRRPTSACRRKLLRDGLRYLALAALAAVTGLLGGRAVARRSGPCTVASECSGCDELAACRRPEALWARQERAR